MPLHEYSPRSRIETMARLLPALLLLALAADGGASPGSACECTATAVLANLSTVRLMGAFSRHNETRDTDLRVCICLLRSVSRDQHEAQLPDGGTGRPCQQCRRQRPPCWLLPHQPLNASIRLPAGKRQLLQGTGSAGAGSAAGASTMSGSPPLSMSPPPSPALPSSPPSSPMPPAMPGGPPSAGGGAAAAGAAAGAGAGAAVTQAIASASASSFGSAVGSAGALGRGGFWLCLVL